MANRSVLHRLTECSSDQQEAVARVIGFDMRRMPPPQEREARAQELVVWATGPGGPGLLSLEAALPWLDDSDMARQFGVSAGRPTLLPASEERRSWEEPAVPPTFEIPAVAKQIAEHAGPRPSLLSPVASQPEETAPVSVVDEPATTPPSEPAERPEVADSAAAALVAESSVPSVTYAETPERPPEPVPEREPTVAVLSNDENKRASVFGGGRPISLADRPPVRDRPERPVAPPAPATGNAPRRVERPATPAIGGAGRPEPDDGSRPGEGSAAKSFNGEPSGEEPSDDANGRGRWWRRLLRGRQAD